MNVFPLPRPDTWTEEALCLNRDHVFAAREDSPPSPTQMRAAANECLGCPVLDNCRRAALDRRPTYGVWAGEIIPSDYRSRREAFQRMAAALGIEYEKRPNRSIPLEPCGTSAAYRRHRRKGEHCPACVAAESRRTSSRAS